MFNFLQFIFGKTSYFVVSTLVAIGVVSSLVSSGMVEKKQVEISVQSKIEEVQKLEQTKNQPDKPVPVVSENLETSKNIKNADNPKTQQVEREKPAFKIDSVKVNSSQTGATIEWETSLPSESKVFVSGKNLPLTVFNSLSGLSSRHIVKIDGLGPSSSYDFEIEAINKIDDQSLKNEGIINTLPKSHVVVIDDGTTYGNGYWRGILLSLKVVGSEPVHIKSLPFFISSNASSYSIEVRDGSVSPANNLSVAEVDNIPYKNFKTNIDRVLSPNESLSLGVYFGGVKNKEHFQVGIEDINNISYAQGEISGFSTEISKGGFISSILNF